MKSLSDINIFTIKIALRIEELKKYKRHGTPTTFLSRCGIFFGIHNKKSSDIINQMLLNYRIGELEWIQSCLPNPKLWKEIRTFVEEYKYKRRTDEVLIKQDEDYVKHKRQEQKEKRVVLSNKDDNTSLFNK